MESDPDLGFQRKGTYLERSRQQEGSKERARRQRNQGRVCFQVWDL